MALDPQRGGGLASGPTRTVCGAGATLPNGMPRHTPPQSSPCPALPWVEQGRARRQSHLGPGAGCCAPPDLTQKALHHPQKETLGCPSSPRCPARGSRAQGQRGQARSSLKAGTEAPLGWGTCFQGPGPALGAPSPPRGTARTRLNRGARGGAACAGVAGTVETLGLLQLPGDPGASGLRATSFRPLPPTSRPLCLSVFVCLMRRLSLSWGPLPENPESSPPQDP